MIGRSMVALALIVCCSAASEAQVVPSATTRQLLPVYYLYAKALRTQGASGLKGLLAPGFRVNGDEGWVTGKKALEFVDQYASMFRGGSLSVRLRQVRAKGDTAVVLVQETGSTKGPRPFRWRRMWRASAPVSR